MNKKAILWPKKYPSKIDCFLWNLYRFKFLSTEDILNLKLFKNNKELDAYFQNYKAKNFFWVENFVGTKIWRITKKGCKKIGVNYLGISRNIYKILHNSTLYKLIKDNEWSHYISEREFEKFIYSTLSEKQKAKNLYLVVKKNFRIPDLVVCVENKKIAIEVELSPKTLKSYQIIFDKHKKQIKNDLYDEVWWFCSNQSYNRLKKVFVLDEEEYNFFIQEELEDLLEDNPNATIENLGYTYTPPSAKLFKLNV